MARSDPQVNFRIPATLNDRLKAAAAANNRTITAELVSRLQQSFEAEHTAPMARPKQAIRASNMSLPSLVRFIASIERTLQLDASADRSTLNALLEDAKLQLELEQQLEKEYLKRSPLHKKGTP